MLLTELMMDNINYHQHKSSFAIEHFIIWCYMFTIVSLPALFSLQSRLQTTKFHKVGDITSFWGQFLFYSSNRVFVFRHHFPIFCLCQHWYELIDVMSILSYSLFYLNFQSNTIPTCTDSFPHCTKSKIYRTK